MQKKIFIEHYNINYNQLLLKENDYNYLANVMRMKVGDKIIAVSQKEKTKFICQITEITKHEIISDILEQQQLNNDNKEITIIQGIPKQQKMEYIIQKCTELGATRFIPLKLKRNVVKLDNKTEKKICRWQKIAQEASRQSERDFAPKISSPMNIDQINSIYSQHDLNIILWEHEKKTTIKNIFNQYPDINKISFTIGSEGGILSEEIDLLVKYGGIVASIGENILRTETASVSIISMFNYAYLL